MVFVSTQHYVEKIMRYLENGENYKLVVPRRLGKTTLVKMVSKEMTKEGIDHEIIVATSKNKEINYVGFDNVIISGELKPTTRILLRDEPDFQNIKWYNADVIIDVGSPTGI